MTHPILKIQNLKAYFHTRRGVQKAVDDVSFELFEGETLGIVGESGSGKTVSQLSFLRLLPSPPLRIHSGSASYLGKNLLEANTRELLSIRGNDITMIFQEPMTSLNPYMTIGDQLTEPLMIHKNFNKKKSKTIAIESLEKVGIPNAAKTFGSYPHEFSGGMRQRAMIAMALITKPKILIADEPTTALDVTVQSQVLELLKNLQKETGMAMILITHDMGIVAGMADRVFVMYGGKIFEEGNTDDIFYSMHHPYTYSLLKSIPRYDTLQDRLPVIQGSPREFYKNSGCPFFERCLWKLNVCENVYPDSKKFKYGHLSFCHLDEKNYLPGNER